VSSRGSITRCLAPLRAGDRVAAQALWGRYFRRLVGLARTRLRGTARGPEDEEEVALSAFDSFYRRAERGQFPRLVDRNDLW
jgi:ECF sigma factor